MIIDAKDAILGRLSTVVAKKALKGEDIAIVNCEKALIIGDKYFLFKNYKTRWDRGTFKGPFLPRRPEMFVKRTIRGMIPYKKDKGVTAFKRIKCYRGIPTQFEGKELVKLQESDSKNIKTSKYVYVKDVCKNLGAKI